MLVILLLLVGGGWLLFREQMHISKQNNLQNEVSVLKNEIEQLQALEASLSAQIITLENEDTRKTNTELKAKIAQVETTFRLVTSTLETISDARGQGVNVATFEKELAKAINLLSQFNYDDANTELSGISKKIDEVLAAKQTQIAITATPAQDLPAAGSYRRQSVTTSRGTFTVSLIAEPASSVKMITDTGNDDTCTDNCNVHPLASYVSRNGGFAGINGTYFCPPDYPSCAGKVNSYNTLVFNSRLKKYMNSDQNVYSNVPMVVQNADRSMRFMGNTTEWGRDTGIVGGIANQTMLVSGGQARVTDTRTKGPRGFVGVKSGVLYIGVVHSADLGDAAATLATLGIESALNLDSGGSSALYYNGKYVVGPGRNLPNAIILTR